MLLNKVIKFAFGSRQNNLAFKISAYVFLLLTVAFGLLITIYHFQAFMAEEDNFMVEILLMRQSHDFPDNIIRRDYNGYIKAEEKIRINEIHDYLIIDDSGKAYVNGVFEIINKQDIINKVTDNIGYIKFGSNTYLISYIRILNKNIYIAKDITFRIQGEHQIIIIALFLDMLMLILIYFLANRLSIIAMEPIKKANKNLKDYNHNLAHELKTPISIMRSDIELAKISGDSLNYARTIEELKHIEDIVNSLLSLSEIGGSGEKRDIRVGEFTGKIVSKIKKNFKKKNIGVELAIIKDFNIKVNDKLFDIMLKNIIENAFKYSLENTNINISVSQNIIKIANTGKIISQDEIDNLFQPFYKGSNSESGYGLGLNIVKTIADQNGWKIRFGAEKEIYTLEVEF